MLEDQIRRIEQEGEKYKIPDFPPNLEWFNSSPLSFERELRGKIVVLDFWTYCCINCMHVLPELLELEKKYANAPVVFIGVHSAKFENEKLDENIREAILRYEIRHPVVNDVNMQFWNQLNIRSWPTLLVIGPQGHLLFYATGEGNKEKLDLVIQECLNYYPPSSLNSVPLQLRKEEDKKTVVSSLMFPGKLAIDPKEEILFISDSNHHRILVTNLEGKFIESIGKGEAGLQDGTFSEAKFNRPQGIAYANGKLYVADAENHALREINLKEKSVKTVAGNGTQGRDYHGGGKGKNQLLSTPWDIAFDSQTNLLFVAMAGTHQIWIYDPSTGRTRNFSGSGAEQNLNAEHFLDAAWAQPSGIVVVDRKIYIADSESSSIRMIDLEKGLTQTLAGGDSSNPRNLFSFGDKEGKRDKAKFQHPLGLVWWEKEKKLIIADTYNHRLKLLDPVSGTVTQFAGLGKPGYKDGKGGEAEFYEPSGFAMDQKKQILYVADTNNHVIRKVDVETREVETLNLKNIPRSIQEPTSNQIPMGNPEKNKITFPSVKLASGSKGVFHLNILLPEDTKYNENAPNRWQVIQSSSSPLMIQPENSSGDLLKNGIPIIPFIYEQHFGSHIVQIEVSAYFCKTGDSVCYFDHAILEVPFENGTDPYAEIRLDYHLKIRNGH